MFFYQPFFSYAAEFSAKLTGRTVLPDALGRGAGAILQVGDGAGDVLYGDDHAQLVRRVHADQRRVQLLGLRKAVLRIRVTFWYGSGIRIRIRGSVPVPNRSGSTSDLQDGN